MTKTRRTNDAIIAFASTKFSLGKGYGIIENPSDRLVQCEASVFCRAQAIAFFEPSTWQTLAPAASAASVAPPV